MKVLGNVLLPILTDSFLLSISLRPSTLVLGVPTITSLLFLGFWRWMKEFLQASCQYHIMRDRLFHPLS